MQRTSSLYRPDSEASRLARGELTLRTASAQMRERYAEAHEWRLRTEGAFTPERPDGVLDLSGIIKGHAIREAGTSLLALGRRDWCLNAGGVVQVTVAAGDIVTADVLATAIVAGGTRMLDRAADNWDVAVLAIRADGSML